jgi:hypothetical protein
MEVPEISTDQDFQDHVLRHGEAVAVVLYFTT